MRPRAKAAPEQEQELEPVPSWVTEGYGQDEVARLTAIRRYREPKTTPAERAAAKAFVLRKSQPCTGCGRYAFSKPTLCYWCRKGRT